MTPKLQDLIGTLRQLFLFDRADLDFGLYRIMNARRAEVDAFLQNRLPEIARDRLGAVKKDELDRLEGKIRDARQQAAAYGAPDPDNAPPVLAARRALAQASDLSAVEDQVYSLLVTFFSRYYEEGDFITRRRYSGPGRERYMIPYDGEEVKLVWANMDQYYIKSDECLRDYRFRLPPLPAGEPAPAPENDTRPSVLLKLVQADVEKDNRKVVEGERRFILAVSAENPITISADGKLLTIPFAHIEQPKNTKQSDLLDSAESALLQPAAQQDLLSAAQPPPVATIPAAFAEFLRTTVPNKTDPKKYRTLLRFHLDQYAARNTYDYFIHKNLGGFFTRELDYFLKSEVLELEDLIGQPSEAVELHLRKVRAVRDIAQNVITFLANLENFQKKLWLKKKFVVETNWCLTLDRVPETLYPEIAANKAQWDEWKRLGFLDILADANQDNHGQLDLGDNTPPEQGTVEYLKAYPFMVVDTALYGTAFKQKLLAAIEDIDAQTDGLLIHSDNFQALNLLQERYREQVKCVYIDPPYNTNSTPILYKNNYKHSSWASLMQDRLLLSMKLLTDDGVKVVAIDDSEMVNLSLVLQDVAPAYNLSRVSVVHNPKGSITKDFNRTHEYSLFLTKADSKSYIARTLEENDTPRKMRRWGENSLRVERRPSFYPIYVKNGKIVRIGVMPADEFHPTTKNVSAKNGEIEIWPIDQDGVERRWNFGLDSIQQNLSRIVVVEVDGNLDLFVTHESTVPKTVWTGGEYDAGNYGNTLLIDILGTKRFDFPKSINLVKRCVRISTAKTVNPVVLDYFGGSATTGHAVIDINREAKGNIKYILIEMGEHFDTVIKPRIQKVIFAKDWKDGKPTDTTSGISHCFKYLRLESYEDTLNNLILNRNAAQQQALALSENLNNEYLLGYFLDTETADSPSLLNVLQFADPWNYTLKIAEKAVGESRPKPVDLIETFNYLIGLKVSRVSEPLAFVPDGKPQRDTDGRLRVKRLRKAEIGQPGTWTFQTVAGTTLAGEKTQIVWRTLSADRELDSAVLEAYLQTLAINTREQVFDVLYVNGDHTLENLATTPAADEAGLSANRIFKVRMIETEFRKRMFAGAES